MKALKWLCLSLGLVLLIALSTAAYLWSVFDRDLCSNSIFSEAASPSGAYKVVIFDRGCGATTGFSTQVSVLKATNDALPNQPGNTINFSGYKVPVSVVWISDKQVSISGPDFKATYTIKTIKSKVAISLNQ